MAPESHSTEARALLATFLKSVLGQPEYWYGPILDANNDASLCNLLGLSENERNLVLLAVGCLKKYGKRGSYRLVFKHDLFKSFLSEFDGLSSLQCEECRLKGRERATVFLVGTTTGDPKVKTFADQLDNGVLPPTVDETNAHRIALKAFAEHMRV